MEWSERISNALAGREKIVVLGAGSVLCGDDAAGMLLVERLQELLPEAGNILLLPGSTAPENFTGVIRDFHPDLLILADAAYVGGEVGTIGFIAADAIEEAGFSTHMLPFSVTLQYLQAEIGCEILIIGIQPGCMEFASEPCARIRCSVEQLAAAIVSSVRK